MTDGCGCSDPALMTVGLKPRPTPRK